MLNFDNDDDDGQEALILGRLRMQRDQCNENEKLCKKCTLSKKTTFILYKTMVLIDKYLDQNGSI
jgi:hypothetical protein